MVEKKNLPRHIGIIMDGNGRWAKKRGLPRIAGHKVGIESVRKAVRACSDLGIEALTLYTFSAENWKRPKKEINILMGFLEQYCRKEIKDLNKNNIRLNTIGRTEQLPKGVQRSLKEAIEETKSNTGVILTLALNYGARSEIVDATKSILEDVKNNRIKPDEIDEDLFNGYLYTKDLPELDLLIRTSGEMRLSNFLLWQVSYSELYVTDTLWPDFKRKDLECALEDYKKRERRFGNIKPKN